MEDGESISVVYNQFNENKKLLASPPIEWRPKLTAIEEAKYLKAVTTEELVGSLIIHEHTLERDWKGKEVDKKKKKDLVLQLLMGSLNGPRSSFLLQKFQ